MLMLSLFFYTQYPPSPSSILASGADFLRAAPQQRPPSVKQVCFIYNCVLWPPLNVKCQLGKLISNTIIII